MTETTRPDPQQIRDAIIIGAGPAGLSAAQALGRSLRRTTVIDAGSPRNRFADHMHNVLGHDGIAPQELNARGRAEAEAYGVEFIEAAVARVRDEGSALAVELDGRGEPIRGRSLIVATGLADLLPDTPGFAEYWGRGVYHCPYCHGWEVRGQRIGIVTTSPFSAHQVRLLRQWTDRLTAFTAGLGELDAAAQRELTARDIVLVPEAVTAIVGDGERVVAVRTTDGVEHVVDAVFTMSRMVPQHDFLDGLQLARTETPVGTLLAVDEFGRTSHERIWAVGNVTNPAASVPMVAGAGTMAGGMANAVLVEEDFARALEAAEAEEHRSAAQEAWVADVAAAVAESMPPADFWERRYASADGPMWSGRVNVSLAEEVVGLRPGRSLDLGCGEGGDVLWLAERGWNATGIDLSPTAVERGRQAVVDRGLPLDRVRLIAADLADWVDRPAEIDGSPEPFDLVTASFLQSPFELPRERILRTAASRVAPGGHLVLVSHAAGPDGSDSHPGHGPISFPSPESELRDLDLDASEWEIVMAEVREREAHGHPSGAHSLLDTVVVVRRAG